MPVRGVKNTHATSLSTQVGHDKVKAMDNYSSRIAGIVYGGAAAEAAAIEPEGTEFSTGTQLGLYVADGLLEVLEWASDGQAADPPASVWLALLRWYKSRYGDFPEGLPAVYDRWIDVYPLGDGDVEDATKTGLEDVEMGTPAQTARARGYRCRSARACRTIRHDPAGGCRLGHQNVAAGRRAHTRHLDHFGRLQLAGPPRADRQDVPGLRDRSPGPNIRARRRTQPSRFVPVSPPPL